MVTAPNWTSFVGLLLLLIWLPAAISGGFQVWFILQRRADTSPAVLVKAGLRTYEVIVT